jgi:hypothetical protein
LELASFGPCVTSGFERGLEFRCRLKLGFGLEFGFGGSSDLSMGGRSSVWSPSVCSEHDPQPVMIKVFEAMG